MALCPFCEAMVSTSLRGYIRRHGYRDMVCGATGLTVEGATEYLKLMGHRAVYIPPKGSNDMGMFDKPQYLTSNKPGEGYVETGDTFWLHRARIDGTSTMNGKVLDQAKLEVSHERDGERTIVFTSGLGITGQIKRMDSADIAALPMELRLDEVPSKSGNNTKVLTPAGAPVPTGVAEAAADDNPGW